MTDHWAKPFCCLPLAVAKDPRLTKTALRVLIALAGHAHRETGVCTVSLDRLAAATGLAICKVSDATARLVTLGWLAKTGKGGRSRPVTYRLRPPAAGTDAEARPETSETFTEEVKVSPETFTESVTVTDSVTFTEEVNVLFETFTESVKVSPETFTESGSETFTESVKGKEQINYTETTKEETNEKEKEEDFCAEPENPAPTPTAPAAPVSPVLVEIDLAPNQGRYPVTQAQIDRWRQDFPAVDVLAQVRKMRAWCEANPRRRKTRRGMAGFIVSWLGREQDRGGSAAAPSPAPRSRLDELIAQMETAGRPSLRAVTGGRP